MGNAIAKRQDHVEVSCIKDEVSYVVSPAATAFGATILLISPKADKQTRWIEDACKKFHCQCRLVQTDLLGVDSLVDNLKSQGSIDLVIIDRRRNASKSTKEPRSVASYYASKSPDLIRQEIHELPEAQDALIAALLPHKSAQKRHAIFTAALELGYHKCIVEPTCAEDAEREMLSFIHSELPLLRRCRGLSVQSLLSSESPGAMECESLQTPNPTCALATEQSRGSSGYPNSQNLNISLMALQALRPSQATLHSTRLNDLPIDVQQPPTGDKSNEQTAEAASEGQKREKRHKSFSSIRPKRAYSRSMWATQQDREAITKMLTNRFRESTLSFMNINTASPLFKVMTILLASKNRCSSAVAKDIQKAIDIICESDAFFGQLFKPANQKRDPLTVDLMEGLMVTDSSTKERINRTKSISVASRNKELESNQIVFTNSFVMNEKIKASLVGDDRWDFDIIALEKLTENKPMVYLIMKIFTRFKIFEVLRIPETTAAKWLEVIQAHYRAKNPYHNATHAADVVQSTAFLMRKEPFANIFDNLEEAASLLAAVIHDLDHPGRTNPFLVNSNNQLAILYNDLAVLENHHVALAFELTGNTPGVNIFQNLSRSEYRTIRGYIVDMVLATEMARHFDHVTNFVNNVTKPLTRQIRNEQSSVGSMSSVESGGIAMSSSTSQLTSSFTGTEDTPETPMERLNKPEIRTIIRRMIIKCSDVNNPTRPFHICKEWANRIAEEYFAQTDEEKQLNLPIVMPNFDRQTCNIPKSQLSFIDFFLRDMFSAVDAVCPIPELVENLEANYEIWADASKTDTDTSKKRA